MFTFTLLYTDWFRNAGTQETAEKYIDNGICRADDFAVRQTDTDLFYDHATSAPQRRVRRDSLSDQ